MQFFFCGLLVATITYFLKLGHNNHGLIFTVVTLGLLRAIEKVGLLRAVETVRLLQVVETVGLLWAVSSMGLLRAYDRLTKHGPIIAHIMVVNVLELKSFVHGPTIKGHR